MARPPFLVGVLSDTHGTLDERVVSLFTAAGVNHIVHAGDVGSHGVLLGLEAIAPLTVVRGNMDPAVLGIPLAHRESPVLGGLRFLVIHEPERLRAAPISSDTTLVIVGHTHRPRVRDTGAYLLVNPGSASMPRGPEGATVAIIEIAGGVPFARIVPLAVPDVAEVGL